MRRSLSLMVVAWLGLAVASCVDHRSGPTAVSANSPSLELVDAAHGNGNPHFFFLPPLVAAPTPTGTFDATESLLVSVCQVSGSGCGQTIVAQFSRLTGTGSEVIRVDASNQLYTVNWHTDQCLTGPCTLPSGNVTAT